MEHKKGHIHGHVEYRYCPCCGGDLEKRRLKAIEPPRLVCRKCAFIFYLDPKVIAGTIFTLDGRIALLRRGVEPAIDKWVFPGGYVDRGESVREAAIRETQEEANVEVRLRALLDVYSYASSPNVIVVYAADVVGGELEACDESVEARTFSPAEIPWEELAFDSTKDALRDYMRLYLGSKT